MTSSSRSLAIFLSLFMVVIFATYTAKLASHLTVSIIKLPINNLEELANSPDILPLIPKGSSLVPYFEVRLVYKIPLLSSRIDLSNHRWWVSVPKWCFQNPMRRIFRCIRTTVARETAVLNSSFALLINNPTQKETKVFFYLTWISKLQVFLYNQSGISLNQNQY